MFQVLRAGGQLGVEIGLRPKDKSLRGDRFEDHVNHAHRRLTGLAGRFEGKQHASFRIGLPENLAEFIRDEHGADVGELELFGQWARRHRLLQADDDRGDCVVGESHLDPVERFNPVEMHGPIVLDRHLRRASPRLLNLGQG